MNGGIETIPSPADIRAFLQKYQLAMDGVLDLLDDYTYYQKHRTHRRPDVWSRRQNWGHLKRKQ